MSKNFSEKLSEGLTAAAESTVSLAKLLMQSRRCRWAMKKRTAKRAASNSAADSNQDGDGDMRGRELVVLGNGPSPNDLLRGDRSVLRGRDLLAVNFAARTPEFFELRPRYYVMADPVFYSATADGNVADLREALGRVDWQMTLFVPFGADASAYAGNGHIAVERFNFLAVDGWRWLQRWAYGRGRGMPRPRNVLIPSLMIGLWLGYEVIYVAGADHSWMRTIEVDEENRVVSVQPHFYDDNAEEQRRVSSVYRGVRLHEVVYSFYLAFRGYHAIRRMADERGCRIINVSRGSYIDAFERGSLEAAAPLPER